MIKVKVKREELSKVLFDVWSNMIHRDELPEVLELEADPAEEKDGCDCACHQLSPQEEKAKDHEIHCCNLCDYHNGCEHTDQPSPQEEEDEPRCYECWEESHPYHRDECMCICKDEYSPQEEKKCECNANTTAMHDCSPTPGKTDIFNSPQLPEQDLLLLTPVLEDGQPMKEKHILESLNQDRQAINALIRYLKSREL